MNSRESSLPPGWYPQNSAEIGRFLSEFRPAETKTVGTGLAAIAPHAGWFYSGKIAACAASSLDGAAGTVAIIGGHLPANCPPLFALEDAFDTPLGSIQADDALRSSLVKITGGMEDKFPDNTVEVLLPMAAYFFPKARILWMRLPAELSSYETGKSLARAADTLGIKLTVLASTDLTHYGANYGFMPKGRGPDALRWMREVNDHRFIQAVESGDPAAVLRQAEEEKSACSAGAVLGAMGFAAEKNAGTARLIRYGTSADANGTNGGGIILDSFVGYAAFSFR